jgi:ATP-dependent RNA helicase DDX21
VHADFEYISQAANLVTVCLYGGTPYDAQNSILRRGCDVVVGTPGRVKDHLERGTLNLASLRFRVLDECDEMLNMGFVDDVEKILNAGNTNNNNSNSKAGGAAKGAAAAAGGSSTPSKEGKEGEDKPQLQTLLFSATMPDWVRDITRRFLRPGHKLVDLVGSSTIKVGEGEGGRGGWGWG